jgi:cell fate regulator YaaT (PSP1 superfamily)
MVEEKVYEYVAKVRIKTKMVNCLCKNDFIHVKRDDKVIVDLGTEKDFGVVFCSPEPKEITPDDSYPVIIDSSQYLSEEEKNHIFRLEKDLVNFCDEKIKTYHLEMEVMKAEFSVDTTRVIVYFTAEKRIDFRELVKDANQYLKNKSRIELWQISAREKAVLIGGLGICGREICCRSLAKIPETVSIRTVKDQHLDINPLKITGLCGKLMCCLTYEHSTYCELAKKFPKVGTKVIVNQRNGFIKSINILKETVIVEFEERVTMECKLSDLEIAADQSR